MVFLWSSLIFAFALSLDGLGVGISYGSRKIKVPFLSLIVISGASMLVMTASMLAGHLVARYISAEWATNFGSLILIGVGFFVLWQTSRCQSNKDEPLENNRIEKAVSTATMFQIQIKSLGLVIQILREPSKADLDHSGEISGKEALFLGMALAMDALAAGFGAALAGYKPLVTPILVGIIQFIMVSLGLYLGRTIIASWRVNWVTILPGMVLIMLGLFKILTNT